MSNHILDAKRLLCPMPVIRTQDKIKTLNSGDVLEVVCTDPGALQDVPAWCRINGHNVLDTKTTEDEVFIIIEVADDGA
jgi:tRNA 2-thiouridine synthesizing protein A